jgi:cytochrome c553
LPAPVGRFIAANLTPAGQLTRWSDGEIFRAIRNGVDADRHWLMVMSLTNVGKLSDDDIHALIAYIRSLPAAGRPTANPPDELNPLGLAMLGAGQLPTGKRAFTGAIAAPHKPATAEYGAYILSYHDCRTCHGADLAGGVPGQIGTIGPSLTVVKGWKLEEFIATLRTGVDPTATRLMAIGCPGVRSARWTMRNWAQFTPISNVRRISQMLLRTRLKEDRVVRTGLQGDSV